MSSTLFIVPTPIGNLADITHRALTVLAEVDLIAAEDTRHSRILLQHYQIKTPLMALHDHNEQIATEKLITLLHSGKNIALISDAGTPLISDPGYHVVNTCRQQGIKVVPLPGACAAITALSASGLPTDRFVFEGFLPAKDKAKRDKLTALIDEPRTMVFYESPRRIIDTVTALHDLWGDRELVLAKEVTKTFETLYAGTASAVLAWLNADEYHRKGEMVLMAAGATLAPDAIPTEAISTFRLLLAELPLKKAASLTAQIHNVKKNALYTLGLSWQDDSL